MSVLRIYFSGKWSDGRSPCPWALCDDRGTMIESGTSLLAAMPKGHDCIAILAADRVLSIAATVPQGGRNRLQALLPFVVEEYSLADPEENHVVPGTVLADGRRMLLVVDRSWLKRIVDSARDAKLSLRYMVAETYLPFVDGGGWTMVWDGSGGFVKTGTCSGSVLDNSVADAMPLALRLQLDAAPQLPEKIVIRFSHDVLTEQRNIPLWHDLKIPFVEGADWDWRRAAIPDDAVNMMWGNFTPRAKIREWWPALRPAIFLLVAVIFVEIVGSNFKWTLLANEKARLSREMQHVFRATFGEAVALVNAPLQMQRNLADLRHTAGVPDSGDFIPLLDRVSQTLIALPPGSVTGLHYESGRLDINLKLARSGDYNALKSGMESLGLSVRLGEIRDVGNGAEARLTLLPEGIP